VFRTRDRNRLLAYNRAHRFQEDEMKALRSAGIFLFCAWLAIGVAVAQKKSNNDAAVKAVYDQWAKAFEARDLDGIMAVYAPGDEVIAYDLVPPLEYKGRDAYRKDYRQFLDQFASPVHLEFKGMRIVSGSDVAFVHTLEKFSGKMKNGQSMELWLRATSGLQKINGKWLIVHDHISVPANMETGKAEMGLKP
jgi:uncharacterized protein (TIGR02246 family)